MLRHRHPALAAAIALAAIAVCSTVPSETTSAATHPPCQLVGPMARATAVVPKRVLTEDRLVFTSPDFSFMVPNGWRLAEPGDFAELRMYLDPNLSKRIDVMTQASSQALRSSSAAPFAAQIADQTRAQVFYSTTQALTVLTSTSGGYVAIDVRDNPSATAYARPCQVSDAELQGFWNEYSQVEIGRGYEPASLTFRSLEMKDYPGSTALALVYSKTDPVKPLVWRAVQFRSTTSIVTFRLGTTLDKAASVLNDLELMAASFRFAK
jgi:hypothetical protein